MKIKRLSEMINESEGDLDLSRTNITMGYGTIYFNTPLGQHQIKISASTMDLNKFISDNNKDIAEKEYWDLLAEMEKDYNEDYKKIFEILDLYAKNVVDTLTLKYEKIKQKYANS